MNQRFAIYLLPNGITRAWFTPGDWRILELPKGSRLLCYVRRKSAPNSTSYKKVCR